jgi:hypothetical protein
MRALLGIAWSGFGFLCTSAKEIGVMILTPPICPQLIVKQGLYKSRVELWICKSVP